MGNITRNNIQINQMEMQKRTQIIGSECLVSVTEEGFIQLKNYMETQFTFQFIKPLQDQWPVLIFQNLKKATLYLSMIIELSKKFQIFLFYKQFKIIQQISRCVLEFTVQEGNSFPKGIAGLTMLIPVFEVIDDFIVLKPQFIRIINGSVKVINIMEGDSTKCIQALLTYLILDKDYDYCQNNSKIDIIKEIYNNILIQPMLKQGIITCLIKNYKGKTLSHYLNHLIEKGTQHGFKFDSLQALIIYHKNKYPRYECEYLFIKEKSVIHLYNRYNKSFSSIKIYRKTKKLNIQEYQVIYYDYQSCFLFFYQKESKYLVKAQTQLNARKLNAEVQLFCVLQVKVKNPYLIFNPQLKLLYIPTPSHSYKMLLKYNQNQNQNFELLQGPFNSSNYQTLRMCLCNHKGPIYHVYNSKNIFEEGIRYSSWDHKKSHLGVKYLHFRCNGQFVMNNFHSLIINITEIDFLVEAQHNVLILGANKMILILDINFQSFFSFSVFSRIKQYYQNPESLDQFHFTYDVINQPFKAKYIPDPFNSFFTDGNLEILMKTQTDIVWCKYAFQCQISSLRLVDYDFMNEMKKSKQLEIMNGNPFLPLIKSQHQNMIQQKYKVIQILQDNKLIRREKICMNNSYMMKTTKLELESNQQKYYQIYEKNLDTDLFLNVQMLYFERDIFGQYYLVIFHQYYVLNLYKQIQNKKIKKENYWSKEISYVITRLISIYIELQSKNIVHSGFLLQNLFYTAQGFLKLFPWYNEPRSTFVSDLIDICGIIFSLVVLQPIPNALYFNIQYLKNQQYLFQPYPGLYEYIQTLMNQYNQIEIKDIKKMTDQITLKLQLQSAENISNEDVKSNVPLFYFVKGTNQFYMLNLMNQSFKKLVAVIDSFKQIKFNKHTSYAYSQKYNSLFILDSKTNSQTQSFYQIKLENLSFQFKQETEVKLQKLEDLPILIIESNLHFCNRNKMIYSFGGIQIQNYKHFYSKRMYKYNLEKETWIAEKNLSYSIVGASILQEELTNRLFFFGGFSQQVNLDQPFLMLFIYNIQKNSFSLKIDMSIQNPFSHCRFQRPKITFMTPSIFLIFTINKDKYSFKIMQFVRGGINVEIILNDEKYFKENQQDNRGVLCFRYADYKGYYLDQNADLKTLWFSDPKNSYINILVNNLKNN